MVTADVAGLNHPASRHVRWVMIYHLYFLAGDNRVERRVTFTCGDDDTARAIVAEHATGQRMELWENARRLERYQAATSDTGQGGDASP